MQGRIISYHGTVQGVGFRWTVRNIAGGYDLTGYVRNLPDGTVEVSCEGDIAELDAFQEEIASRMRSYIRRTSMQVRPVTRQYREFFIRH